MDTAGFSEHFPSNPNKYQWHFLYSQGNWFTFSQEKKKIKSEDSTSAVFKNTFDCSNQVPNHLQWQQRELNWGRQESQWLLVSEFDVNEDQLPTKIKCYM